MERQLFVPLGADQCLHVRSHDDLPHRLQHGAQGVGLPGESHSSTFTDKFVRELPDPIASDRQAAPEPDSSLVAPARLPSNLHTSRAVGQASQG
jgi:hypothetical protein